jgi:glycosyltransferase involved in cell wall biosynthesis
MPTKQDVDVVDNKFYSRQNSVVQEEKSGEKRPYFVCCGRFVEKKNYAAFVKTYIHTYLRYPGSIPDLHLVGDGPLRNQIERTAGKMLGKNIKLHGFLGSSEVRRIFHGAHAFFHPATYDQWGLVVNEAMAAGLPVAVSSASGCCKDLVEHRKNGWRFDSACSEDVAETILKAASLSKLEWLSMSKASVAKISDWGLDRHVKAFWSVHAIALESRAKFLVGHQNIRHLTARLLTTF